MGDLLDGLNIRQKIMACFSLAFLVCLLILGLVVGRMVSRQAVDQAQRAAQQEMQQADAAILSMERLLKSEFLQLSWNWDLRSGSGLTIYSGQEGNENGILTMNPEEKGGFELTAYQIFQHFAKRNEKVTVAVTYGMQDGGYVQYPAVTRENNYDPRNLYWYRDGMAAGESGLLYVSQPFQGSNGKPVIGFYALVWSPEDTPAGVLGYQIDLGALLGMALPEKNTDRKGWMVLDGEDAILLDERHPDAIFRKLSDANLGDLSLLGQRKEGMHRILLDDAETYAVIYTSETTGLKYIRLLDEDEVTAGSREVRLALILLFFLSLGICFFASRWLAGKITAPFRAMEEQAEAIGAGRLKGAAGLLESDDEVGRLSLAFQEMAGELGRRLESVRRESESLAGSSSHLTEGIAKCRQAASEALEKIRSMTSAEEKQAKTVGEVAGQLDGLAESLSHASEGMKEIGEVARQLGKRASEGREGMKESAGRLSEAQVRIDAVVSSASLLDRKALQASELIQSIGEMAEQLNLLALNAAVESARAGSSKERNKFTAVAEEVRQLSEQSSKAARKAALVVSALQQEALQASKVVKDAATAVGSGKDSIQQRDGEFQKLEEALERIEGILTQANAAVQSMGGSGKRIKDAAEQVAWGTRKSADAAETVERIAEEQTKTLAQLEKLSKDLTGAAESLRARTESFEL